MNEPTLWDAIKNPEWITAVLGGIALLVGSVWVRGKTETGKKVITSPHQEVLRPETASEIKAANALNRLAESAEKIERHIDLHTRMHRD